MEFLGRLAPKTVEYMQVLLRRKLVLRHFAVMSPDMSQSTVTSSACVFKIK